jgi:REP element-mobilizing transposase RayT
MDKSTRPRLNHETPIWVTYDATFFITICTEPRGLNQLCTSHVGTTALNAIRNYQENQKWFCHVALLMPDHVHFILSFPDIPAFAPLIGDWKRWLTRNHQIRWQENFFDHRLRADQSLGEKAEYILHNPVRAGYVQNWEEWPYVWVEGRDSFR